MNEQTVQLIEKLAEKLGTTSEYLWAVLVKQAPISAAIDLGILIFSIIFGIVLLRMHRYFSKNDKYDDLEELVVVPMIIMAILFAVFIIAGVMSLPEVFSGFFNPEYWALKEVMDLL